MKSNAQDNDPFARRKASSRNREREIKSRADITSRKFERSPLTPENLTSYYSHAQCAFYFWESSHRGRAADARKRPDGCFEGRSKGARSLNEKKKKRKKRRGVSLGRHLRRVNYEICLC